MSQRRRSTETWHLVQFTEDEVWYICPPTKIKLTENECLVRWKDGRWYPAIMHDSGDQKSLAKILEQKQAAIDSCAAKYGIPDEKIIKPKQTWRRMCNVKLSDETNKVKGQTSGDTNKSKISQALNGMGDEHSKECRDQRKNKKLVNSVLENNSSMLCEQVVDPGTITTVLSDVTNNCREPTQIRNNSVSRVEKNENNISSENLTTNSGKEFSFNLDTSIERLINQDSLEIIANESLPKLNDSEVSELLQRNIASPFNCLETGSTPVENVIENNVHKIYTADESPLVYADLTNASLLMPCQQFMDENDGNPPVVYCNFIPPKRTCTKDVSYGEETEENVFAEEDSLYEPGSFSSRDFSSDFQSSLEKSKNQCLQLSEEISTRTSNIQEPHILIDHSEEQQQYECVNSRTLEIAPVVEESQVPDSVVLTTAVENSQNNVVDFPDLQIATLSSTTNRKWDKKFLCPFCRKLYSKLPRHMYTSHSEEREIALIMSLEKKSHRRKMLIQELENRGTFLRNKLTIKEGVGKIIPKRRIQAKNSKILVDYVLCPHCYQMFRKTYLYRHVKLCTFNNKKDENSALTKNRSVVANSFLMLPVGPDISDKFKENILSKMSGDAVFRIIRTDQLILLFGETEYKRLGHDKRYHRTIIDRCRELGRLVYCAKGLDKTVKYLKDLIYPSKYKLFRDTVFSVAGYNSNINTFKTPSLALKIGYTIKKCISLLKGEYLEDDILRNGISDLDLFSQILDSKWHNEVTSHAHRTLTERKWNAPKRIPLTRDIQVLHNYLTKQRDIYFTELSKQPSSEAFQTLTELTLVLVIILNRRRVGDVQYTSLDVYEKARGIDSDSDVFATLSETEKQLANCFKRLIIRGKRGRGVPILLTNELQDNIELLIAKRNVCGVDRDNKYLFPSLRHACGYYRACDLLTYFAKKAGCEMPNTITSTKLRKHVSTMVQLLNLKDHELDALAQFLGHDIRVHRKHYRLQDETIQLAKISKILVNFNRGQLNAMKGKSLDEIDVNDLSDIEFENEVEESEDMVEENETANDDNMVDQNENNNEVNRMERANTTKGNMKKKITYKKEQSEQKTKTVIKRKWSEEEAKLVSNRFKGFLVMKKLPGKNDIEKFLDENKTLFANRTWRNIKDLLYGKLKKMS